MSEKRAKVSEEAVRISRRIGAHILESSGGGDQNLEAVLRDRASAAQAALDGFLRPQSIAVVGASSDPNTIAGLLFANLVESHFAGAVLPVNRRHTTVQGVVAYPDLTACPVVPDLVIVCVPAPAVRGIVAEAGTIGTRSACVISAGFAETGTDGAGLQTSLVAEAARSGVRLVGPNCTGILGGIGDRRFNATFSRAVPLPGRTALLSQSGAIGLAVLEAAETRGLGIGAFVSVGNSSDIASNDLLLYWGRDPAIDLILLYLEEVQDPRWFTRIAQRVGKRIPIVVVKAGRTAAGSRAAASHTAALSGGDVAVDALLRQAGVIRAESIEEMLDLATLLSSQRRFRGRRVAVVTNGGGPGILAADACESNELVVPVLTEPTKARLRSLLSPEASASNPVDMIASATAQQYGEVSRVLGAAGEIDALIVMYNTPLVTQAADVANELIVARSELGPDVALVTVFMNQQGPPPALRDAGVPSFAFPENAARALGRSVAWQDGQARREGKLVRPELDANKVGHLMVAAVRHARDGWLRHARRPGTAQCLRHRGGTLGASQDPGRGRDGSGRARWHRGRQGSCGHSQARRRRSPTGVGGSRRRRGCGARHSRRPGVCRPGRGRDRVPRARADRLRTGDDRWCQPGPHARVARHGGSRWHPGRAARRRCRPTRAVERPRRRGHVAFTEVLSLADGVSGGDRPRRGRVAAGASQCLRTRRRSARDHRDGSQPCLRP